jgi:proteic killer suppression protein
LEEGKAGFTISFRLPSGKAASPVDPPYSVSIHYTLIRSYKHKGLQRFAETGSRAGIQPKHAKKLHLLLTALDAATAPEDMNVPGSNFHPLRGSLQDHWALTVGGNWRLTFAFEGEDLVSVDYVDYH